MSLYLFIDIVTIIFSFIIIKSNGTLRFYHPGIILLFYHVFTNSLRFFSVINGANVAFADYGIIQGASEEELIRALIWSDIALLSASFAIFFADSTNSKWNKKVIYSDQKIINTVIFFTIPIGIWGAFNQLYIPQIQGNIKDFGEWGASSYIQITQAWFGLSLLALIYFKGFKKIYVIPLLLFLLVIGIQGYHRYRLILPLLFLLITYLFYKNLNWPKRNQIILILAVVLFFYPLKTIGTLIQEGGNITDIELIFKETATSVSSGNADDQSFLDQYASTLTEIDRNGKIYYGSTLLPLLYLPIPRLFWEDKPKLNEWQADISTETRPFDEIGSVATIYGESYANFRYFGIILIPAILFYYITRWYKRILLRDKYDISKFFYAVVFCCLIQVMRDGLISLFMFPVLNNMPLFLIYIMHKIKIKPIRVIDDKAL